MPTFDGLVDDIIGELHARASAQEQHSTLLANITSGDQAFVIDTPEHASRGLYEIDNELVYVKTGSAVDGVMTVPAWGRGQQGTTPAAHLAGSRVTRAPRFPRQAIINAVQEQIQNLYPDLYRVGVAEITSTNNYKMQYEIPAEVDRILAVEYRDTGSAHDWLGIRRWKLDTEAPTDQYPTGTTISIGDIPMVSTRIRIHYAALPLPLVAGSDNFTVTGFRSTVADLVRCAVLARFVVAPEVAKGQLTAVDQSERSALVQTGSTTSVARYYQTLFEKKLVVEKQALRSRIPLRITRTWQ